MLKKILLSAFVLTLSFAANAKEKENAPVNNARAFVQSVGDKTLAILASKTATVETKETELKLLFTDSIDIEWISHFVMGRYWRDASTAQQTEFSTLYREYLIQSYVPKFKEYTNQKLVITNATLEDEDEYLVQTEIVVPDAPSIRVDYKVRADAKGKFQIFDIVAEGISMITTQRSEFASILSREGVDHLISQLRAKVAAQAQPAKV